MGKPLEPDLRDRLEYAALAGLLRFMRAGSRDRGAARGAAFGRLAARAVPLRRRVALANIAASFPDWDRERVEAVYRGMLENLGVVLADFARFGRDPVEPVDGVLRLENPEAFAEAQAGGRGGILLTAHFGNWEALGAAAAFHGFPVTVLGGRQRNPLVEDLFERYRARMGLGAISRGDSLKPILRALRAGQFVATLADQDGGRGGFFIDFLGRKASVQSGLFRLCARARLPLVTGFSMREGSRWRGRLQPPEWPRAVSGEAEVEAEARRLAALYTARVEEHVRARPDHWFWVHRRWHTRPREEQAARAGTGRP